MITVSTKFKELILGPNSFASIFNGGRILLYTGARPANADAAAVSPPLAEITAGGVAWAPGGGSAGGVQFEQSGQWILKNPAQPWKLHALASGVPTWFRLYGPADDPGSLSYSYPRVDGDVSDLPSADMVLPNVSLTENAWLDVQQFLFTLLPIDGA